MKKFLLAVSMLALSHGIPVCAQSIDEANAAYRQFIQLSNSGNQAQMYDVLYSCYKSTIAVLDNAPKNSANYRMAYDNMKNLIPYLANGASYSSGKGMKGNAVLFARAYVDVVTRPDFSSLGFIESKQFAQLSYYAAAYLVNSRRQADAIPYLRAYLRSGEQKYRKTVFANLIKACTATKDYQTGVAVLDEALISYPNDYSMLSMAVNFCIDSDDNVNLQRFVNKGLAAYPNDKTLLNLQGKLYEDKRDYNSALDVYKRLQKSNPNALDVVKHLALNNYNIGVMNYNKALSESDKGEAKKLKATASQYFNAAIGHLTDVVASDPASLKYNQALAVAYNCVGNTSQFEKANNKLASLGAGKVASDYIPSLISYSGENVSASSLAATSYPSSPGASSSYSTSQGATSSAFDESIPAYSTFAKNFIEEKIEKWQQKDPYETLDEYRGRVTEAKRDEKIKELKKQAEAEYISRYQDKVNLSQLELKPYDAEHGVFLVTSEILGQLIVPVPRENNEARLFESNWNGMQFNNPKYFINDDHLALASLTFVTPMGKQYQYDNDAALNYTETKVDVNFKPIDHSLLADTKTGDGNKQKVQKQNVSIGQSDVDVDIPETGTNNKKSFAVVIANENYDNVAGVPMALNDGSTFKTYCQKTLGMPEENIRYYPDASYGTMLRAIRDIRDIANAFSGDINIVFYYAGHGIPNEATKDAFLLPVDADGTQTEGCYSLNKLYGELGALSAQSVVVFLDACFSGSKREQGMLASARGVALKPKKEAPRGNMVVFSAATDDETAFPYEQKGHGLFTYYLLKKLQESKGDVSLGELSTYITENVKRQSVVINRKVQTPTATPSSSLIDGWTKMRLK